MHFLTKLLPHLIHSGLNNLLIGIILFLTVYTDFFKNILKIEAFFLFLSFTSNINFIEFLFY